MASASLPPVFIFRAFDANGNPLVGGKLYAYAAGTTTPQATYTDQTGATPAANPLVLDANGQTPLWMGTSAYKFDLTDANGVQQPGYPKDNVLTTDALVQAIRTDLASTTGAGMVSYQRQMTGAIATDLGKEIAAQEINAVSQFGLVATAKVVRTYAAANTTALNNAIAAAAASGRSLYIPSGWYCLNALATCALPFCIYGDLNGPSCTVLDFGAATGKMFNLDNGQAVGAGAGSAQELTTFDSMFFYSDELGANNPDYYIYNTQMFNVRVRNCCFLGEVKQYAIANERAVGMNVERCNFQALYGGGILFMQSTSDTPYFSTSNRVINNHFEGSVTAGPTYNSKTAIEIQAGTGYLLLGNTIESYVTGVKAGTTASAAKYVWGLACLGNYFEGNQGYDIDLQACTTTSHVTVTGGTIVGPTGMGGIHLGSDGVVVMSGLAITGGQTYRVAGSANAKFSMVNCGGTFTQVGTFTWMDDTNDTGVNTFSLNSGTSAGVVNTYWYTAGTMPVLGNGTITGWWKRSGNTVTLSIKLTAGSTTTFGTNIWNFTIPGIPAAGDTSVGSWLVEDSGTAQYTGAFRILSGTSVVSLPISGGGNSIDATHPQTWAVNDNLELTITYRV